MRRLISRGWRQSQAQYNCRAVRLTLLALLTLACIDPSGDGHLLELDWNDRYYGIGVVSYDSMVSYSVVDTLYPNPYNTPDFVAVLDERDLCFAEADSCTFAFSHMIEFDYEIPGWAVAAVNADTTWAWVELTPAIGDTSRAWVRLRGGVRFIPWPEILTQARAFFLHPDSISFRDRPGGSEVSVELTPTSSSRRF